MRKIRIVLEDWFPLGGQMSQGALFRDPVIMEIADSRYMSEEAFAKASRTADKELFIVPGATHIRTYFVKEYVDQISAKIQGFYTEKL